MGEKGSLEWSYSLKRLIENQYQKAIEIVTLKLKNRKMKRMKHNFYFRNARRGCSNTHRWKNKTVTDNADGRAVFK